MLKCSEKTVKKMMESGTVPSRHFSERVVRIPREEFIGKSASGAAAADPPVPPTPPSDSDS